MLQLAHISVIIELTGITILAGIEGEHVFFKHSLKKPDYGSTVFHDEPVLRGITTEHSEAELLIELLGGLDILNSQTDRECAEFHYPLPFTKRFLSVNLLSKPIESGKIDSAPVIGADWADLSW